MQTVINPKYAHLNGFIKSIPSRFNNPDFGTTLHSGRNIVKRVEFNGLQIVVKSYCRISLLNRLIYGRLRKSKSHRAYNHYLRLKSLGIDSPEAIAAIDTRHNGKIVGSFFCFAPQRLSIDGGCQRIPPQCRHRRAFDGGFG